ncbi:hypothetical protein DL96DRAFT_1571403 [Flagelloscypha sp. PMI_526]|nr:hypothetical protein DL96DRAFT_1571403 [Flagelloscypha sp. PMI_526]
MITFYDIPFTKEGACWSPNTFKTRFSLELKGIPYTTVWVEYPDIEAVCKKVGAPPTRDREDGTPYYSCPFIVDSTTGQVVVDSWKIALYLDETYPDTPRLVPLGHKASFRAFMLHASTKLFESLFPYIGPETLTVLNPASRPHFRWARELESDGETLESQREKASWEKVVDCFNDLERLAILNETDGFSNGFFIGSEMTWADIVVCACLGWGRAVYGVDSQFWKDMQGLNGGRWMKLLEKADALAKGAN